MVQRPSSFKKEQQAGAPDIFIWGRMIPSTTPSSRRSVSSASKVQERPVVSRKASNGSKIIVSAMLLQQSEQPLQSPHPAFTRSSEVYKWPSEISSRLTKRFINNGMSFRIKLCILSLLSYHLKGTDSMFFLITSISLRDLMVYIW
jgi:hypothetical protein